MENLERFGNKNEKEKLDRMKDESRTAYLSRTSNLITSIIRKESGQGMFFDPYRAHEKDLSPTVLELISKTMKEARYESTPKPISMTDAKDILESIERSIGTHRAARVAHPKDESAFEKTQRRRKFFEIQPGQGAAKRETYWNTLFFPYNTESTRVFAKEILDGKIILLLGGGRARLKEELKKNNISPHEILNIDPFISETEPEADPVVPISAANQNLPDVLRERDIKSVDEIWAEYSVPAYLENPNEIRNLFQNIDALLAEGGYARIWPTEVKNGNNGEVNARKTALLESLNSLITGGKYEITAFRAAGRPGFTLHKLKAGGLGRVN